MADDPRVAVTAAQPHGTRNSGSDLVSTAGAEPDDVLGRPQEPSATSSGSVLIAETAERLLLGLLLVGVGLLLLALLAACYFAAAIVLPVALAFVLMLMLRPALRICERWHAPRIVAALVLIVLLFAVAAGLASVLAAPAADWAQHLPAVLPRLQQRLHFLGEPIRIIQKVLSQAKHFGGPAEGMPVVTVEGSNVPQQLVGFVGGFLGELLETVVILFFLLMAGDTFLRRLVEILPGFKNKRQAVEISQQIESDISVYLMTIALMNAGVGIVSGLAAWLCQLGDPVLWGTLAFLLNFVPVLGPAVGVAIFFIAGLLSFDTLWQAALPAALYLGIHIVEGESLTPWLLARRFTLNPVLVIVSLVFWYWMWGVPGAVLSTPMLATAKIICDRIQPLAALGHFMEG
jgi:predicted PurR-regulated permease PerM